MKKIYKKNHYFRNLILLNEKGQGFAEYSWILVLIAVFVLLMLQFTGERVENKYIEINSAVTNAMK